MTAAGDRRLRPTQWTVLLQYYNSLHRPAQSPHPLLSEYWAGNTDTGVSVLDPHKFNVLLLFIVCSVRLLLANFPINYLADVTSELFSLAINRNVPANNSHLYHLSLSDPWSSDNECGVADESDCWLQPRNFWAIMGNHYNLELQNQKLGLVLTWCVTWPGQGKCLNKSLDCVLMLPNNSHKVHYWKPWQRFSFWTSNFV